MIRIEFTEQQIEDLNDERYHHPHPRVQQEMEVLYLKSQGLLHHTIRKLCQISKTFCSHHIFRVSLVLHPTVYQIAIRAKPLQCPGCA